MSPVAVSVHEEAARVAASLDGEPPEVVAAQMRRHVASCLSLAEVFAVYHRDRGHAADARMAELLMERSRAWAREARSLSA